MGIEQCGASCLTHAIRLSRLIEEKVMYATPEQITATNKAGAEAILAFANAQFAAFERLSTLNFSTAKTAVEESIGHAKALLNAKDLQEIVNLNAAATQPALEKAVAYSHRVYEVASKTQAEMTKFAETQAAELNKNLSVLLEKFSKNAPAGSDVAVAAVRSALAAANSAYDSFNKVAKQATEIAESNFAAATSATKEAKKRAA
jgi:phasin family protein